MVDKKVEINDVKNPWINPLETLQKQNENTKGGKQIFRTGLMVNNSLTKGKSEFITKDGSKNVKWYMCGPTVYDDSHLGHARTYLSSDIMTRIMKDYFGYNVELAMNITDIDDKIINKCLKENIDLTTLTRKYEKSFFDDMRRLNILLPDHITRVTEYIDEIVVFIEKLISNGYAYESNGSVYFDIKSYTDKDHQYAKLDPSKIKTTKVEEIDGALGAENAGDKKNDFDFALWKKAKKNEPLWKSPWSEGRPGWHVECSVMCCAIFGDNLDIHSGGVDLKFPHHDNEIAQTEGHYDNKQWINYFFHTGHLDIEGLKMSKSEKNFIKIIDVLEEGFNSNTIRIQFLNHKWDTQMDYNRDGLISSSTDDKTFREFFFKLRLILPHLDTGARMKFNEEDNKMMNLLKLKQEEVHKCLCDNFNTEGAILAIKNIITAFYNYEKYAKGELFKPQLGATVGKYVISVLKSFGLEYNSDFLDSRTLNVAIKDKEHDVVVKSYINLLVELRDRIRILCQSKNFDLIKEEIEKLEKENLILLNENVNNFLKPYQDAINNYKDAVSKYSEEKKLKEIFIESDKLRDQVMPSFGVKLKDATDGGICNYTLEYYEKEDLKKEIELDKLIAKEKEDAIKKEKEEKAFKVS